MRGGGTRLDQMTGDVKAGVSAAEVREELEKLRGH